jgi:glycosyltransferase involved in cell wall biosynthesis
MKLTFAFCTYKRADRLPALVAAMRAQECPIPFEILAVNNNSPDNTLDVLEALAQSPGPSLRFVTETGQGIVPARNRALQEALESDFLVFIDDDELPQPGLLNAACDALMREHAHCAGGRVQVDFSPNERPRWLGDELLGFLAEVDHGPDAFWIQSEATPVWTANVAYDMRIFRDAPQLRFDRRFNREGTNVGGGEDMMMFRALLERGMKIRYRPDMAVRHFVEPWRLRRTYFLKLHYNSGLREGQHGLPDYPRLVMGIPPFMVSKFLQHSLKTLGMYATRQQGRLRQAMNAAHALGMLKGYAQRAGTTTEVNR